MRPFESLFLTSLCSFLIFSNSNVSTPLWIISSVSLVVHILREFIRWQLVFAYFSYLLISFSISNSNILLFFTLLSSLLSYLLPIPNIPELSPHDRKLLNPLFTHTGSHTFSFKIPENESSSKGSLYKVKVYYPIDRDVSLPGPQVQFQHFLKRILNPNDEVTNSSENEYQVLNDFYLSDPHPINYGTFLRVGISSILPNFIASHFTLATTQCLKDHPLSNKNSKWPVVLLSHGLTGWPENYSYYCIHLARLGMIVVTLLHTDGSAPSFFTYNEEPENSKTERVLYKTLNQEWSPKEIWQFRNQQLERRVNDLEILIQYLDRQQKQESEGEGENCSFNEHSFITKTIISSLDLSSLSVIGHSFGGATALQLAKRNSRVGCAVCLDGWLYPIHRDELEKQCDDKKTVLIINSDHFQWKENLDSMHKYARSIKNGNAIIMTIKETSHHNFNDVAFYAPHLLSLLSMKTKLLTGSINPVLALNMSLYYIKLALFLHWPHLNNNNVGDGEDISSKVKTKKNNIIEEFSVTRNPFDQPITFELVN